MLRSGSLLGVIADDLTAVSDPKPIYGDLSRTLSGLPFIAFLTVGGEWFLMWQSPTWNAQDGAFRMFLAEGLILLLLLTPELQPHERLP